MCIEKVVNHYMSIQMVEISEHKYYMSEKLEHDVGYEVALHDWVESGHAKRFYDTYIEHKDLIESVCDKCNKCNSIYDCRLPNDIVHKLMEDE